MPMQRRVILLHADAPPKPPPGAACNGCGVCCATTPCPLGKWLSRRLDGRCARLVAVADADGVVRHRCGALAAATSRAPRTPRRFARLRDAWTRRAIGAGRGCDCSLEVETPH